MAENHERKHFNLKDLEMETQGKYQFNKILGRGAYGIVIAGKEIATGREVAVKRVERIFDSTLDAKRILREIRILTHLKHENITNIIDLWAAPRFEDFTAIVIVMDLMDTDMYQIINSQQPLLVDHHKYFIYQLLRGLKFIHSAGILHRDLKPGNLMLNANCDLKIGDFGLARVSTDKESNEFLSEYVATRWYRSPEVLLNYDTYGTPLDMWSVGCILAELINRKPLFPGASTMKQLQLIVETIGSPTEEDLEECTNYKAREFMNSIPYKEPVDFMSLFPPGSDPVEVDMVARLLKWDPRKRLDVEEALDHPFVHDLHDPFDEPVSFEISGFEFERQEITIPELKVLLWQEVLKFHPQQQ
ncbi:CMGC family protein kinase [Tritrichomonas foetus]|uniref:Mitogen-activated protein kinase n=1 Tax=Tritrichomonas foetus TaxID=1144522 RepID=A0A1J4L1Q1_9EUKA|nr:CMGC family protein kinase [Tritrichomonas foetus]|eukprot:OHT17447.1 CMGC family protein kinase [Tritrichomonas foetus]